MSSAKRNSLYEAAVFAAGSLPASWTRTGQDRMLGQLAGSHGRYRIGLSTVAGRLFHVKVSALDAVPAEAVERINLVCMDANWQMPTACFSYSPAGDGSVMAQAAIALDRCVEVPDERLYRNLLGQCVLNSELLWLVVEAVNKGTSVEDARAFRSELFRALFLGELGGLPTWLRPEGPPPAAPEQLIDACAAAATAAGWEQARRAPDQLIMVCAGSPATGPVHTDVDVHEQSLIVSSHPFGPGLLVPEERRPAVAVLLNRILESGVPFGLALDLQSGDLVARSYLDLAGVPAIPSPELLCDVIFQSAAGAFLYLEPLVAVAHEGADPDEALAQQVARQLEGRQAG
ncbi:MAG: hypothetical protein ABI317_11865 [Gaiellales bacterium]